MARYISVFETDFGTYYLGPHLEGVLSCARDQKFPAWLPEFARSWFYPKKASIVAHAWRLHDKMCEISETRWKQGKDTTGVFEIGKDGSIVVTEPTELE